MHIKATHALPYNAFTHSCKAYMHGMAHLYLFFPTPPAIIRSSSNVNSFLNSRMIKHVWAEDWSEEVVPDKVTVIPIGFETNIENLYHILHEVGIEGIIVPSARALRCSQVRSGALRALRCAQVRSVLSSVEENPARIRLHFSTPSACACMYARLNIFLLTKAACLCW